MQKAWLVQSASFGVPLFHLNRGNSKDTNWKNQVTVFAYIIFLETKQKPLKNESNKMFKS